MQSFAPAKVNLFLHVGARADDGYHPICSLIAFADIGDRVAFDPSGASFAIEGPFAAGLSTDASNLVIRARDAFLAVIDGDPPRFGLRLHKALPIASGLGGGSSDAAATLRLLDGALMGGKAAAACRQIASGLGSDTPACLQRRATVARGRGDLLAPAPPFPDLDVVLVNSGVTSETPAVYAAFDTVGETGLDLEPRWPAAMETAEAVADFLSSTRNDLEPPAITLRPEIGAALAMLRSRRDTTMARMTGSGATCFALCADPQSARRLAADVSQERPRWWVRPCRLLGTVPADSGEP